MSRTFMILRQYEGAMVANLKSSLESAGVSRLAYRIGEYGEEAVCLEKKGNSWIVYNGERGRKNREACFTKIRDACIEVLRRTIPNREELDCRIKNFPNETKRGTIRIRATDIADIISNYKLEVVRVDNQGKISQIRSKK